MDQLPTLQKGSPGTTWDDYFAKERPDPEVVRAFIRKLHEGKRYDHVIAAIQAAILHGQEQPWMYEVLALTMEVQGYPKDEVDRVLLSAMDAGHRDYTNTMFLATYLVRLQRDARALEVYREASRLGPERPEPYLLGLKLARRLKDINGIEWACSGILQYAWGKDHERQQKEAAEAAADALKLLRESKDAKRLTDFQKRIDEAKQRDLQLRLEWSGDGDLDLSVEEPGGTVCSETNSETVNGGWYLHDGYGPQPENCYESYLALRGQSGAYRVIIRKVGGTIVANRATLTVTRYAGSSQESSRKIAVELEPKETTYRISLHSGRRPEPASAPKSAAP